MMLAEEEARERDAHKFLEKFCSRNNPLSSLCKHHPRSRKIFLARKLLTDVRLFLILLQQELRRTIQDLSSGLHELRSLADAP